MAARCKRIVAGIGGPSTAIGMGSSLRAEGILFVWVGAETWVRSVFFCVGSLGVGKWFCFFRFGTGMGSIGHFFHDGSDGEILVLGRLSCNTMLEGCRWESLHVSETQGLR